MKHFWPVTLFVALASAPPAGAQSLGTPNQDVAPTKWVELGGGLGAGLAPGGGALLPSLQARVNLTSRVAIDVVTDFNTGEYSRGIEGTYLLQIHQTVGASHPTFTPFVTYGGAGNFEYRHVSGLQYTLSTGDTVVFPAYTYRRFSRPFAVTAGGGVRARLARNVFLETGAQLVAVEGGAGVLVNVGISVPIGRGR